MSNVITNDRFATRLRRERERLGMTQNEFAIMTGVSRMSQVNYESGKRYPGEAYFKSLEATGLLDELYLLTGRRKEHYNDASSGTQFLFRALTSMLGLELDVFEAGIEEMTAHVAAAIATDEGLHNPDTFRELDRAAAQYVEGVFARSPEILNEDTFLSVVQKVEEVLLEVPARLSPAKKARLLLMLYRQHRAAGRLSTVAILDAINLAE